MGVEPSAVLSSACVCACGRSAKFSGFITLSFTEHDAYSLFVPIQLNILFFFSFCIQKESPFPFLKGEKSSRFWVKFKAFHKFTPLSISKQGVSQIYFSNKSNHFIARSGFQESRFTLVRVAFLFLDLISSLHPYHLKI